MESLNIPFIADTTIRGGTFQTPIIQSITHGQKDNSRLFHTREDDGLPFHYCSRTVKSDKFMLQCSNNLISKCKAKFWVKSKNPDNIIKQVRPGKKSLFRINYENHFEVDDFEVQENTGNFEHTSFCTNQVPLESRVYDFDIMNSRDRHAIQKEKKYKYTDFSEEAAFQKEFRFDHTRRSIVSNKDEINSQAAVMNALEIIDDLIDW